MAVVRSAEEGRIDLDSRLTTVRIGCRRAGPRGKQEIEEQKHVRDTENVVSVKIKRTTATGSGVAHDLRHLGRYKLKKHRIDRIGDIQRATLIDIAT